MLVLLPPSEGKRRPVAGPPVDLDVIAFPELRPRRAELLDRLARLCAGDPGRALDALGLSAGMAGEVAANARLRDAPTAPAAEIYSGVLYERLGLSALPPPARRRADAHVVIASALWGALRPADRIPAYRLSIGARLPGLPGLAAWWRPALSAALPSAELVVDLRSGAYAAAWRPAAQAVVAVRAFTESAAGARRPVSHMAKRARGDVARALLLADSVPGDPDGVAAAAAASGLRVELAAAGPGRWTLDVVERAPRA